MIRIKSLQTGNYLDLAPGQQVTFTIEAPLFADDRMPLSVSTGIEFPLSPANLEEFGFVNAMMLSPRTKIIPASIVFGGVEIFKGELKFDEFSDETLKYTFTQTDTSDSARFTGKIHDIESEDYYEVPFSQFVRDAKDGVLPDFGIPMIIRKANSAKSEYATPNAPAECTRIDKYANLLYDPSPYVVPAVKVGYLIGKILPGVVIPAEMQPYMDRLAIIGTYKPEGWRDERYGVPLIPWDENDVIRMDHTKVAQTLPDMTCAEFLSNVLKMFCATLFVGRGKFEIRTNKELMGDDSFVDWTDKAARVYSIVSGEENGGGYSLEYANEPGTYEPSKVDDLGQAELDPSIQAVGNYTTALARFSGSDEYINVQVPWSRNIYSGKKIDALLHYHFGAGYNIIFEDTPSTPVPIGDIVYQASVEKKSIGNNADETANYDCSVGFDCARCTPTVLATPVPDTSTETPTFNRVVAPVVDFPTVGTDDRPTTIYIGLLFGQNMLDQGNYFSSPDGTTEVDNILSIGIGGENGLYEKFHKGFAEWISGKNDSVKADVFLTPSDISTMNVGRKIMLHHRLFYIKSMELTISDDTDVAFANTEFIEA